MGHERTRGRGIKASAALLFAVFILGALQPPDLHGATIEVNFDNPPERGTLVFRFYNSANAFGDLREAATFARVPVSESNRYVFPEIPAGEYALIVFKDENQNGQLDRNFIGIPAEPIAFSNRYRPKGPPSYNRARFVVREDQIRQLQLELYRPLGRRGLIGAGIGVIGQTSPYKDADEAVWQPIPAVAYNGERFQILGPRLQAGLFGSGDLRLAATAEYRIGAYDEDDSPFLDGLGDRKDTLMAGVAVRYLLPGGFSLSASYEHDLIDRLGGGEARAGVSKSYQWADVRFSPRMALNWMSSKLAEYDFGVPENRATALRPAYSPGSALNPELGIGIVHEFLPDWWMILDTGIEFLDQEITDSPIVSEHYRLNGFWAINYVF